MTNQPPHTPPNVHNANSLIWFNDDVDNGVKLHNNVPIIYIIFISIKPFGDLCLIDQTIVTLEETAPIRLDTFHHRM